MRIRPNTDRKIEAAIEALRQIILDAYTETDEIREVEMMQWKLRKMLPKTDDSSF